MKASIRSQRGPHGIDIEGSFTSESLDSQPTFLRSFCFLKCKSLYKFPHISPLQIFWCSFAILGEGSVIPSTIHLPHSFFFLQFIYMYRKTKHFISVVWWRSYWVLLIWSKSNHKTKPSWRVHRGNHVNAGERFSLLCRWSTNLSKAPCSLSPLSVYSGSWRLDGWFISQMLCS